MRLRRLDVRNVGCIRAASLELGPGLNVLYGPNDLGKSTLARALRFVLLVPHASVERRQLEPWEGDETPVVELTFETEKDRVWRVVKSFGEGARGRAELLSSRDGTQFSPDKKAREVDDELRRLLAWGIAGPATKGAPKGLPTSFLSTVLLGEQSEAGAVLAQAITSDSNESGKLRLTEALSAHAQAPLLKELLVVAQGYVDQAFTPSGKKKRDQRSPFLRATNEVVEAQKQHAHWQAQRAQVGDAEHQLAALREELERAEAALADAQQELTTLRQLREETRARAGVLARLKAAEEEARAQAQAEGELAAREAELAGKRDALTTLRAAAELREAERLAREDALREAKDALTRAQSDEAEQARRVRALELEKAILREGGERDAATRGAERAARALATLDDRDAAREVLAACTRGIEAAAAEAQDAVGRRDEAERERAQLELAGQLYVHDALATERAELDEAAAHAEADRARAAARAREASAREAALDPRLPEVELLEAAEKIAQALALAEARLGGGLSVALDRLAPVEIAAEVDGERTALGAGATLALEAEREIALYVADLVTVRVRAGSPEARREVERLSEDARELVAPLLARAGATDLAALRARVEEAERARRAITEARREAVSLVAQADARAPKAARRAEVEAELARLALALAGAEGEAARARLAGLRRGADAKALRARLDAAQAAAKQQHEREDVAWQRAVADLRSLDEARMGHEAALQRAERAVTELGSSELGSSELGSSEPGTPPAVEGDARAAWEGALAAQRDAAARCHDALLAHEAERARLAGEQDGAAREAEARVVEARAALDRVTSSVVESTRALAHAQEGAARLEGELVVRREAVLGLDIEGVRARIEASAIELAAHPAPARPVDDEALAAAARSVAHHEAQHTRARDALRTTEGALSTLAGPLVLDRAREAREALEQAERRERALELDFDAWKLLLDTLRTAENEEGAHLGAALAAPVTARFEDLTLGRYGRLELDRALTAEGIRVQGNLREIRALSAGTQEQLATLLRLTVAEQLESALVLDDHLTQTDPERSAWFRATLRAHAQKAQILVLTCRPLDYVPAEDLPSEGEVSLSRAAGLVRVTNLARVIERAGDPARERA